MIKAVLFDADNTLYLLEKKKANSLMFSYLANESGISREKIEKTWESAKSAIMRNDYMNPEKRRREFLIKSSLIKLGLHEKKSEKLSKEAADIFRERIVEDIKSNKSMPKIIANLRKKYHTAVTSEEFEKFLKSKLNAAFIDWKKYFEFVITPEKTGVMKPSKKYYQIAVRKLKLSPAEAVVIGDSWDKDLAPANEMGMQTILLSEKMSGSPTHWIKNVREIDKIL